MYTRCAYTRGLAGLLLLAPLPVFASRPDPTVDQPNPIEYRRRSELFERRRLLGPQKHRPAVPLFAEAKSGVDRTLVILVEFAGTDTFTFTPTGANKSTWDPIGKADPIEWNGNSGDCSLIVSKYNITGPKQFTYSGPLHNKIPRPPSVGDRASALPWLEDFNPDYYQNMLFGDGVQYRYTRSDGSSADDDVSGVSLRSYYLDLSRGAYDVSGDVVGWVQVPHSVWWYGADPCPGRNSAPTSISHNGAIPNAGSARSLVVDALEAVKRIRPGFDWKRYDVDGDGVIDHLFIVHAGMSQNSPTTVLERVNYGEGSLWPYSDSINPLYQVAEGIEAGPFILMAENSSLGVSVHEFAHNLGAVDLYDTDGSGAPAVAYWSVMASEHVGQPEGSLPPATDAWHLDFWGWLNPLVIDDASQEYRVEIGATGNAVDDPNVYRGVQIRLPDQQVPLPVRPNGTSYWWGGAADESDSRMTLLAPVLIPSNSQAVLRFNAAYDLENQWDFLWVQVSTDDGKTWRTLVNEHTVCRHETTWIGGDRGFPSDLCAAGIGGFTGRNARFPALSAESFNLSPFAGRRLLVRFWYMTDWNTLGEGPFIDDFRIDANGNTVMSDDGEAADTNWQFSSSWRKSDGSQAFPHSYYLQWRNVSSDGGVDRGLGQSNWAYGPYNTGLLIWYENTRYGDNRVRQHLFDSPSFGPKGRLLLVDAHPEPERDPASVNAGFANESANLNDRLLIRDAPFSLEDTLPAKAKIGESQVTLLAQPGVPLFSDAVGYFPGIEFVPTGPKDNPPKQWITSDWNAGVVIPATTDYPVKGPGYRAGQTFYYYCFPYAALGTIGCYSERVDISLPTDGGLGNPGETSGQYGWNVEIVNQSSRQASLRIWNSRQQ